MSKMDYNTLRFAWTDLETTGFDKELGGVLEIATIVTDRFFKELGRFRTAVYPGEEALCVMPEIVVKMHTENGLLDDVTDHGTPTTQEADKLWAEFLRSHHGGNPKNIMMAGNSIARVDIPFTETHLPLSDAEMHYRYLDVTSFRIAAGIWFGEDSNFVKKKSHRAFDDVEECIAEFEHVAHEFFVPAPRG